MTTIASFVFIISAVSVWYHIKKKPNKKNRNISILVFLVSFIVVGVTAPNNDPKSPKVNESSYQKDSYYFNENEAKEFALYFKEHAEVIDKGNKIEFIAGADKDYVSARVGEIWKDESVNRKIYLSNELLKEKNKLFKEWLNSKDNSLNSEKYVPKLIVTVSDTNNTVIAQEYDNEMKVIKK